MFSIVYTLLTILILTLFSPILLIISFRNKYRASIPSRFFLWKNRVQKSGNSYWFHGCSLGEINAMKPFIKEIQKSESVSITTTTDTGFRSAQDSGFQSQFLPFEPNLIFWIKKQKKLIVLEAELWYLLFFIAKIRGIETTLLSGRISDRSFPKYIKAKWFYSKIFANIDTIFAQSEIDKQRFEQLGAKNIEVIGNIKLLKSESTSDLYIPKDKIIIVGASTHFQDEKYILSAFLDYGKGRLILVPRHKERFDEVWKMIRTFSKKYNFSCSRFSDKEMFDSDIVLVDRIGLLINIYSKSDIVILGGGFYDGIGGHNPVEPASFKNKIISGKFMFNQNELLKSISNIQFVDKENIGDALNNCKNIEISEISQNIDFQNIVRKILIS